MLCIETVIVILLTLRRKILLKFHAKAYNNFLAVLQAEANTNSSENSKIRHVDETICSKALCILYNFLSIMWPVCLYLEICNHKTICFTHEIKDNLNTISLYATCSIWFFWLFCAKTSAGSDNAKRRHKSCDGDQYIFCFDKSNVFSTWSIQLTKLAINIHLHVTIKLKTHTYILSNDFCPKWFVVPWYIGRTWNNTNRRVFFYWKRVKIEQTSICGLKNQPQA